MTLFRVSLLIIVLNVLAGIFGWWQLYLIRHIPENERLMIDLPYILLASGAMLQLILCGLIFVMGSWYWLFRKKQKGQHVSYNLTQEATYSGLCGLPIFFVSIVVITLMCLKDFFR